jgi:uncharacterized protein YdiU (UPF0061 family)
MAVGAAASAAVAEEITPAPSLQGGAASGGRRLEDLEVSHIFVDELPGDPETKNHRRQVKGAFYSLVEPTPTGTEPQLVAFSPEVAAQIGLDPAEAQRSEFAAAMSGNAPMPHAAGKTYAQCYGGHQFGYWAGQLGDGRAISLGQVSGPGGTFELQLKGAGETPYSRSADGRAVLRSSVREFIASEALAALGIPTTRALSLVTTGAKVLRDMFYNGNPKMEPGAVVCRVSPAFIRFGTFQLPSTRPEDLGLVRRLADYTIRHHYPHLEGEGDKYERFLREVVQRTAKLVAAWQAVGFTHGVLNTDNMSILGETIDYGPYGFMERFDPNFTPNTSDLDGRRYAFRQQPQVCYWNLLQLAAAFVRAEILEQEKAEELLEGYSDIMTEDYQGRMAAKMGLNEYNKELAVGLLSAMYEDDADFTNTFRALGSITLQPADGEEDGVPAPLLQAVGGELSAERRTAWAAWAADWRRQLQAEGRPDDERQAAQNAVNPAYIPRNHVMQTAIAAAEKGNSSEVNKLMDVLKRPFDEQPGAEAYTVPAPKQTRVGVELLSCSS